MAEEEIKLVFRATGDERVIQRVDDLGRGVDRLAEGSTRATRSFAGWQANLITFNQALELAQRVIGGVSRAVDTLVLSNAREIDMIAKTADALGVQVRSLSSLRLGIEQAGLTLENFRTGFAIFQRQLQTGRGEGAAILREVVGDATDAEQALLRVADVIQALPQAGQRTALATLLFGETGGRFVNLLERGSEGIRDMQAEAHELGLVFDQDTAAGAEELNDQLAKLQAQFKASREQLAIELLPEARKFTDWLTETLPGAIDTAKAAVGGFTLPVDPIVDAWTRLRRGVRGLLASDEDLFVGPPEFVGPLPPPGFGEAPTPGPSADAQAAADRAVKLLRDQRDTASDAEKQIARLAGRYQELIDPLGAIGARLVELNQLQEAFGFSDEVADQLRDIVTGVTEHNAALDDAAESYRRMLDPLGAVRDELAEVRELAAVGRLTEDEARQIRERLIASVSDVEQEGIAIGATLRDSIVGGVEAAIASGRPIDLEALFQASTRSFAARVFGDFLEEKLSFDAIFARNFLEDLPAIAGRGADFIAQQWRQGLGGMIADTDAAVGRITGSLTTVGGGGLVDASGRVVPPTGFARGPSGELIPTQVATDFDGGQGLQSPAVLQSNAPALAQPPGGQSVIGASAGAFQVGAGLILSGAVSAGLGGVPPEAVGAQIGAGIGTAIGAIIGTLAGGNTVLGAAIGGLVGGGGGVGIGSLFGGTPTPGTQGKGALKDIAEELAFPTQVQVTVPTVPFPGVPPGTVTNRFPVDRSDREAPITLDPTIIDAETQALFQAFGFGDRRFDEGGVFERNSSRTFAEGVTASFRQRQDPERFAAVQNLFPALFGAGIVADLGASDEVLGFAGAATQLLTLSPFSEKESRRQARKLFGGRSLTGVLDDLNNAFVEGRFSDGGEATPDDQFAAFRAVVTSTIDLLAEDVPAGVNAAQIAFDNLDPDSGLQIADFNERFERLVDLMRSFEEASRGAVDTGIGDLLRAQADAANLQAQGAPVTEVVSAVNAQQTARADLRSGLLGNALDTITAGFSDALLQSPAFQTFQTGVGGILDKLLQGEALGPLDVALTQGNLDQFLQNLPSAIDAAATVFASFEETLLEESDAIRQETADTIGQSIEDIRFGRLSPVQQARQLEQDLARLQAGGIESAAEAQEIADTALRLARIQSGRFAAGSIAGDVAVEKALQAAEAAEAFLSGDMIANEMEATRLNTEATHGLTAQMADLGRTMETFGAEGIGEAITRWAQSPEGQAALARALGAV